MRQKTRAPGAARRDLLHFGLAVDREQPDAERVGARDVALLLDGVAEGDAVGRGAGSEHHLDLGDRGGVEAGAERGQQRQQFRRRVRLHGVEHPAVRQRLGKGLDSCRARRRDRRPGTDLRPDPRRGGGAGIRGCARSLARSFYPGSRGQAAIALGPALNFGRRACAQTTGVSGLRAWRRPCVGDTVERAALSPICCLGLERENPFRTAGKNGQASSVLAFGQPTRPKKPAPSLL